MAIHGLHVLDLPDVFDRSRSRSRYLLVAAALSMMIACGRPGTSAPGTSAPAAAGKQQPASAEWTREEWLQAAEAIIAAPATMPRLSDAAGRARFEKLVTTKAWLKFEPTIFQQNGEESLRFFPAAKKLMMLLSHQASEDELVLMALYTFDVEMAFVAATMDFIAGLPPTDESRPARLDGLATTQRGGAITLCGILYSAVDASEGYRAATLAKLTNPARYTYLSREALQLIMATLDEKLLPSIRPALLKPYQEVRAVVALEYDKRAQEPSPGRTTYQGIGPANSRTTALVSTTGHFSVSIGPAGLAKRVEFESPDGAVRVQHWIELQEGEMKFESVCADGVQAPDLVATFQSMDGAAVQPSKHPGTWLTVNHSGREAHLRIMTIGGRGCLASVEGPSGQVPAARAEAFLLSLQAAP